MEIQDLLKTSVEQKASDLHILPESQPLLRINGDLSPIKETPILTAQDTKRLLYSILTEEQKMQFEKNLVSDIGVSIPQIGNFRLSVLHQRLGVAAVFRVIPEKVPTFEELNLPAILKSLLGLNHGLILVTGPTGSGKSTTLATMVDYINTIMANHIITIEDPIEFIYKPKKSIINQLQVGRDTPDFATALRASLRQDPNVILLGEMRDLETIRLALTAAETGHLVMSTLHASSAALAVSRIIDIFPTEEKNRVRNLLAETVQAIICQMLMKKIAGGRIAAFEIMLATPAIRHMIRQDMTSHMESAIQTNGDVGMCTFEQYMYQLQTQRLVTQAEVRNVLSYRGGDRLKSTDKDKAK